MSSVCHLHRGLHALPPNQRLQHAASNRQCRVKLDISPGYQSATSTLACPPTHLREGEGVQVIAGHGGWVAPVVKLLLLCGPLSAGKRGQRLGGIRERISGTSSSWDDTLLGLQSWAADHSEHPGSQFSLSPSTNDSTRAALLATHVLTHLLKRQRHASSHACSLP